MHAARHYGSVVARDTQIETGGVCERNRQRREQRTTQQI
jgi:hypothetical protein